MAAALAGMVSSSAWFTIAQRHKISSIGKQIHPPLVEDDSLARADKKRSISSSELGSQASGSSSLEFIPVKKSKTTTPDDSVPRPATETLEEVFEKAMEEYQEELDKEEQALAQKNEQQNINQPTHQAPDEQAEPIPAQQDEQQDAEQQTHQVPHEQAEPIPAQQDEQQDAEQQTHQVPHEQAEPIPAQQDEQQDAEQQTHQVPHEQAEAIPAQQDEQQDAEQQTHQVPHEQAEPIPAQQDEQQDAEQQTHQVPHEQAEAIPAQQDEQQDAEQQTHQVPHEQAEPIPAQQDEQQDAEQQTHQVPHEQAEPIPAQQDEQQDTKQADQHELDPLEALLTAHEENFEHQEKRARQTEQERQRRLVFSAFGIHPAQVQQRQPTLHQFVAPKEPDLSAEPPTTPPPALKSQVIQVIDLENQAETPVNPARKRLRWKQPDPPSEQGSVEPPPKAEKDCDEHVDTGEKSEPEDPDEDGFGKKRKWGQNKRGDSISIYRKLEAIKQYEELVEQHGKKVGSQMFYALKLPGQSMYICNSQAFQSFF